LALLFDQVRVLVRGGGDLGSGVVYRLHRAGFPVVVTELENPLCVRRTVSFGAAVWEGAITVDGITARRAADWPAAEAILRQGDVPVLADAQGESVVAWRPMVEVDARMAKRNLGITLDDAPLVVALGPGFEAGMDCHAVIETNRGHFLGRVFWRGQAEPDTGVPGNVNGITARRVLRAPVDGFVAAFKSIGDPVQEGETVALVGGQPVVAAFDGILRGLAHERAPVTQGLKIGDVDPRVRREHCFTISEKALAVGGGVLEAIFFFPVIRDVITGERST